MEAMIPVVLVKHEFENLKKIISTGTFSKFRTVDARKKLNKYHIENLPARIRFPLATLIEGMMPMVLGTHEFEYRD